MEMVGIRDLKTHLSRHLKRVRAGARLLVTDHGRCIAAIAPIDERADLSWAHRLVAEGRAHWTGGKPAGCVGNVPVNPHRTVSAAVLEDRR
jgi:prevent-host-death family protein